MITKPDKLFVYDPVTDADSVLLTNIIKSLSLDVYCASMLPTMLVDKLVALTSIVVSPTYLELSFAVSKDYESLITNRNLSLQVELTPDVLNYVENNGISALILPPNSGRIVLATSLWLEPYLIRLVPKVDTLNNSRSRGMDRLEIDLVSPMTYTTYTSTDSSGDTIDEVVIKLDGLEDSVVTRQESGVRYINGISADEFGNININTLSDKISIHVEPVKVINSEDS